MISMNLSEVATRLGINFTAPDIHFSGCSIDSRTVQKGNLFIALSGEKFDGHEFISVAINKGANAAIVEKEVSAVSAPLLLVKNSLHAMARLAESWRSDFNIPLLAVTGSNGKTTVKEMISSILGLKSAVLSTKGNLNNELGVPLTLFGLGKEHKYAVIEMGANHPGEIARLTRLAKPTVAVITQCAPAHLEGFGSIDGVARAKGEIYSGLEQNGTAVVNADDAYAGYWSTLAANNRQISFGLKNNADVRATDILFDPQNTLTRFTVHTPSGSSTIKLPLAGVHNVMNALAAIASCSAIGLSLEDIRTGLEKMTHVHGRMQMLITPEGSRLFDDTHNANPASLNAGLQVLSSYTGQRWLILGDMGELGDYAADLHRQAGETARKQGVDRIYAIGTYSKFAVESFGKGARHFVELDDLLHTIKSELSPAITLMVKGSRFMAMDRVVKTLMGTN